MRKPRPLKKNISNAAQCNLRDVEYWVHNPEGNSCKDNLNEIEIGELNDVHISREMVFPSIGVKTHFKITFPVKNNS